MQKKLQHVRSCMPPPPVNIHPTAKSENIYVTTNRNREFTQETEGIEVSE